jgi:hypothetical protein
MTQSSAPFPTRRDFPILILRADCCNIGSRKLKRALAILAVASAMGAPAHAGGGISCYADDRAIKFNVGSPVGQWAEGTYVEFGGYLIIKRPGVAQDFRELTFARNHFTHRWIVARDLKVRVQFQREGAPHGTIDLIVEASGRPEAPRWRGRYDLTISDTVDDNFRVRRLTGEARCSRDE